MSSWCTKHVGSLIGKCLRQLHKTYNKNEIVYNLIYTIFVVQTDSSVAPVPSSEWWNISTEIAKQETFIN